MSKRERGIAGDENKKKANRLVYANCGNVGV
jgi:hypothetical protein